VKGAIPPRPYLREEVYQRLKKQVAELSNASAEPVSLREADIARRLGVSRTPVREALGRLQQEGLVEVRPHRGAQISPTSVEEYLCWLEFREVLEGMAARLAARQATPALVAELRGYFRAAGGDPGSHERDDTRYLEANARFHTRIIEASGSTFLLRLARAYDYLSSARRRVVRRLRRVERSMEQHDAIIDALALGDAAQAERLSREHVNDLRLAVLASLEDAATGEPSK